MFEDIGGKCYPCQFLTCNSNGRLDFFKRNFHIRFAAIIQFLNVHQPRGELGQVECDVMLSLPKESSPTNRLEVGEELEHFDSFVVLFDAAKMIRRRHEREATVKKFVGSSSCCLSNGGRILRTFG